MLTYFIYYIISTGICLGIAENSGSKMEANAIGTCLFFGWVLGPIFLVTEITNSVYKKLKG